MYPSNVRDPKMHRIDSEALAKAFIDENVAYLKKEIGNEKLYQVADTLVSTYNPEHPAGGVKEKVQIATLLAKRFDLSKEGIATPT